MTDDRVLLDRIAAAFGRHDPLPDRAVSAAVRAGAFVGRHRNGLVPVAIGPAGLLRAPTVGPTLRFVSQSPAARVDVEVTGAPGRTVIMTGAVVGTGVLVVRWPDGERVITVDDVGRFAAIGLPRGPLGIALRWADGDVVGPWFVA